MSQALADSPYMKTAELAELLGVTPNAVRVLRHRGLGPRGFRRGKNTLYLRTTVAAWLQEKEADDRLGQRAAA